MTAEELKAGKVVLINKPYKWTSFQVVNKMKHILRHNFDLKKIKIGHAGTLDPLATGLLIVCIGKETKAQRPSTEVINFKLVSVNGRMDLLSHLLSQVQ